MKKRTFHILIVVLLIILFPSFSVSAQDRENPSLYSFGEIVNKLPKIWLAHPQDILEMMSDYPDFECWRSYDLVGCASVNNKYSREIHVNFLFTSEADDGELERIVFTMPVGNTETVQKLIEAFWIEDLQPANISGAKYPSDQVTLYFSTENTLMTYRIEWGVNGIWLVSVDIGLIRG